ncbi:hypothetical protein [Lampropedia cohaerens]|uniref:hypothetical protein n=1 Tax=Lampropedia cohaerens TaxID=1610491 RepID=UPI0012E34DDC|nr:hypothetical protein [Lampropedia cohaerens]
MNLDTLGRHEYLLVVIGKTGRGPMQAQCTWGHGQVTDDAHFITSMDDNKYHDRLLTIYQNAKVTDPGIGCVATPHGSLQGH